MASQVRPGLTQPNLDKGLQQSGVLVRRQSAHSIRARDFASHTEAECMAAIYSCEPNRKEALGIEGASMYVQIIGRRYLTHPRLLNEARCLTGRYTGAVMSPLLSPLHLLLVIFAGWVNRHQLDVIEYLQEENRVLKGRLGGQTPYERLLAKTNARVSLTS